MLQAEALALGLNVAGQVTVPEKLQSELRAGMETAGIPVPENEERWEQALTALKVLQFFGAYVPRPDPCHVFCGDCMRLSIPRTREHPP